MVAILNLQNKNRNLEVLIWQYLKQKIYERYPVALVIGLIAAIFVICLSVPAIVYKATSDETVIERLHNFDS